MTRNWGLPTKSERSAFRDAKTAKPVLTLIVSAIYGALGAVVAGLGFSEAAGVSANLFHGPSLFAAVLAAGFGCWLYIWIARQRFAAHFTGEADAFADLLRFYVRGAIALLALFVAGELADMASARIISALILCMAGGAAAAAAFQTVIAFVPAGAENRQG